MAIKKTKKGKSKKLQQQTANRRFFLFAVAFIAIAVCLAIVAYTQRSTVMVVSKNGVSLDVDTVTYDTKGEAPFEAPPGMKFVIIHATLNNTNKEAFNFAPVTQTYLTDSHKNHYDMAPAALTDPIVAGSIAAGEKRVGSISFLVPAEAEGLRIGFNL